ncbi:enoyl-CoA hydratase-related protein [Actinocorallia sp. API 0066]|uniref:enoyl-CoA hydratase-related protein n=1 Tax=Actinocorallia sp. API 0066 TaxID=2896846 RepID=UPI001E423570|nr:enoyl-CoA hydratase-related protein [Actinocorallia sp. API 0066]MCD0449238.1 enoyl-CoA hydratase-related protein [Actinocorallia sp. API 0066]
MVEPTEPLVRVASAAGVTTLTLDSPRNRNALSRRLLAELAAALDAAERDPEVRVVVLTGAGPVFCSGADLKEQGDGLGPGPVSMPEVLTRILDHRRPVVARVNGAVRAGGLGLMAACDIVVAPDTSTFAFSEVRLGVIPAMIAVPVLARMDAAAAHEYFLTGEPFDAAVAERTGLVNRAVSPEELDAAVARYTGALVKGGPSALAAAKRLVRTVRREETDRAFALLEAESVRHFTSAEGQAGIAALLSKRPAPWIPDGSGG